MAYSLVNLASSLADDAPRRDEAITLYREGIAEEEKLAAEFPESPDFRALLAMGHNGFGTLLRKIGHHPDAEVEFRRSIEVSADLVRAFPGIAKFAITLAGTLRQPRPPLS